MPNLFISVREKTSKDTTDNDAKTSASSNNGGDNRGDADKHTSENNHNTDLITSTIEETECDWEYAHVRKKNKLFIN